MAVAAVVVALVIILGMVFSLKIHISEWWGSFTGPPEMDRTQEEFRRLQESLQRSQDVHDLPMEGLPLLPNPFSVPSFNENAGSLWGWPRE